MATRQSRHVDIQERADFDHLLGDLDRGIVNDVVIDVEGDENVLSTAAEFEELALRCRATGARIAISSDDPIRRELAFIYGLEVASNATRPTVTMFRRASDKTTVVSRPVDDDELTPASIEPEAAEHIFYDQLLAPRGGSRFDPDASYSFVVTPPVRRRADITETTEIVSRYPARNSARPRKRVRRRADAVAIASSVIVIVGAVAVLLVGLLAPSASVVIVPETTTVSATLTYGVDGAGVPLDIAIQPETIATTLQYEGSTTATGERHEPDAPARGMVFLTNPSSQPIAIPAGAELQATDGGQTYMTVEDIEIPAADPFGSATFGTAVVDVVAIVAGPAGNLGIGGLAGELSSGVLYQNRFPIDGGTERTVRVATEADLDRLLRQAEDELTARIPSALDGVIDPEWQVVDGPRGVGPVDASFGVRTGEDAEEVTIVATLTIEAKAFDPRAMDAEAAAALDLRLVDAIPDGYGVVDDSRAASPPERLETSFGVAYRISATAVAAARFEPAFESDLSRRLEGKREGEAREIVRGITGVESVRLAYGPDWLPWEPVPRFANRITVAIDAPRR